MGKFMLVDRLTSLIQEKYSLTRNERAVVHSIFFGSLERPAILFITSTKCKRGLYHGWSINASNFFDYLNRECIYENISGIWDCEEVEWLKKSGCRKGVITEALKLVKKRMENNI